MGFEDLIGAIGQEAARQRVAIGERAAAEAREILGEAEEKAARLIEGAAGRGEAEARGEAARVASRERLAARRELLAARQRLIDETLRLLEERLRALPAAPGHDELLGRLLAECAAGSEGPLTVRCRPQDRPALEARARALGLEAAFEEAPLPLGGVETASRDGRVVCRNGFADRLEAARPRLLEEAGRVLFGGEGPAP